MEEKHDHNTKSNHVIFSRLSTFWVCLSVNAYSQRFAFNEVYFRGEF